MTVDKINMVKSRGANFEQAVEELRKTFSIPEDGARPARKGQQKGNQASHNKAKNQKNKMMKVLKSMRKKKAP